MTNSPGDPVSQQQSYQRNECLQLAMQYWRDQQGATKYPLNENDIITVAKSFYNYVYVVTDV